MCVRLYRRCSHPRVQVARWCWGAAPGARRCSVRPQPGGVDAGPLAVDEHQVAQLRAGQAALALNAAEAAPQVSVARAGRHDGDRRRGVSRLLAGGAPGLHVYTLNQAAPTLALLARVGGAGFAPTN